MLDSRDKGMIRWVILMMKNKQKNTDQQLKLN